MFLNSKKRIENNTQIPFVSNKIHNSILDDLPELSNENTIDLVKLLSNFEIMPVFTSLRQMYGTVWCKKLVEELLKSNVNISFLLYYGLYEAVDYIQNVTPVNTMNQSSTIRIAQFQDIRPKTRKRMITTKPKKLKTVVPTKRRKANKWKADESKYLHKLVDKAEATNKKINWCSISKQVNEIYGGDKTRYSAEQHYKRVICTNNDQKEWSIEEEIALIDYVKNFENCDTIKWCKFASKINKTDAQCRYFYKKYYNKPEKAWKEVQIHLLKNLGDVSNMNWTNISKQINNGNKFHHSPLQCKTKYEEL